MPHQSVAHAPRPVDALEDAVGQIVHQLDHAPRGQRRLLGGLQEDGVPCGQRRGDLPGGQKEREVPGDDAGHDADGFLYDQGELLGFDGGRQVAYGVAGDLTVVVEAGGRPTDLVVVLDIGLAALVGHDLRQLVGVVPQVARQIVEQLRPVEPCETPPLQKPRPCAIYDSSISSREACLSPRCSPPWPG